LINEKSHKRTFLVYDKIYTNSFIKIKLIFKYLEFNNVNLLIYYICLEQTDEYSKIG